MGFRTGAYATVWEVIPLFNTNTKVRVSISRKDKDGNYVDDFSGYIEFIGSAVAQNALKLKEKDRIKLDAVDVSTQYDKEKNRTYYHFKCFKYDKVDNTKQDDNIEPQPEVDSGELEDSRLPF